MEGRPRDRRSGHRVAVAAATLPRLLDQALRPAPEGSPTCQRRDQGPGRANGRRQSAMGRTQDPRRAPHAGHRRLRAHRLSADRKSTRLNSSHVRISYAVFCLKKKKNDTNNSTELQTIETSTYTNDKISIQHSGTTC